MLKENKFHYEVVLEAEHVRYLGFDDRLDIDLKLRYNRVFTFPYIRT